MSERYNVLLITSDQHRWDALGAVNSRIRTPHLDALAARGILFDRAYTSSPVCTPARVSILTGQYPSRHGCYTIGTWYPETAPTVPGLLSERGVFTAICGKAHFQPCTDAPLGDSGSFEAPPRIFDLDRFDRWTGPYYGFEHTRLAIAHSCEANAAGMHYGAWLRSRGVDAKKYFGNWRYDHFGPWSLPEEHHNSRWTADETIAALDLARDSGRPFFLWSSFQDPHNPCVVPEPWASMYRPEDMPLYAYTPGEFDDKPPFYRALLDEAGATRDADIEAHKPWLCVRGIDTMDEAATRRLTAIYYGMVSLMDHHIGRVLRHLDETGLAERTIVVFTSDHGDYLGNHGLWWKGLPAYDDAQRVPFIVAHPKCHTPGARGAAFQNLVDIPRTALAALGVDALAGIQGVDQLSAWTDAAHAVRSWNEVECRPTEGPFMQKTFLYDHYKLVVYHDRPYGELYDMTRDPDQFENLWERPESQSVKADLMARMLSAEMEKDGALLPRLAWA